jgi:hypothetical protein
MDTIEERERLDGIAADSWYGKGINAVEVIIRNILVNADKRRASRYVCGWLELPLRRG